MSLEREFQLLQNGKPQQDSVTPDTSAVSISLENEERQKYESVKVINIRMTLFSAKSVLKRKAFIITNFC